MVLDLDPVACFALALALSVTFDNAAGSVIAACLNDASSVLPNLALAQKLWDAPEEVLRIADPGHSLFRLGLVQRSASGLSSAAALDWRQPIFVPVLVAEHLLSPGAELPRMLRPLEGGIEVAYKAELEQSADRDGLVEEIKDRLTRLRAPIRTAEIFSIEDIIDPRDTRPVLTEWIALAQRSLKAGPPSFGYRP